MHRDPRSDIPRVLQAAYDREGRAGKSIRFDRRFNTPIAAARTVHGDSEILSTRGPCAANVDLRF